MVLGVDILMFKLKFRRVVHATPQLQNGLQIGHAYSMRIHEKET